MKRRILWFISALLATQVCIAAETVMYVQSAKANLMSGPGFDTGLLNVLQKGDSVTLVKEEGRWAQVKHGATGGWMSRLLLAAQPPMEKVSVLKGNQEQLEKSARQRASTGVTAAATRGLRGDEQTASGQSGTPDFEELQEMEAVEIKEAEVREFHEQGLGK